MKIHKGTMLGLSIRDWLTYTNVAYLLSLLLTFALTATLWRVSVAAQNESDTAVAKNKAESDVQISQARAQAASAALETERLKATLQWRTLEPTVRARLVDGLRASPQRKVHLAWVLGDPESVWLGQSLAGAFSEAGWQATAQVIPIADTIPFGISIPLEPTDLNGALRSIFNLAGISVGDYPIPQATFSLGGGASADEATVFIGIRMNAFAGVSPN